MPTVKNESHSEPDAPGTKHTPASGGMQKSRNIPQGFTWVLQRKLAIIKAKQRAISLATCNPDYQVEHPNECRDNPENKLLKECHPEAAKRIEKKLKLIQKKAMVPAVQRPSRLNKVE